MDDIILETKDVPTKEAVTVGDYFTASWGYDQTNIDYYEAVAVSKTGRVKLQRIEQRIISRGCPNDEVVPVPGAYVGDPTGYKIPRFYFNGYAGQPEAFGERKLVCYVRLNTYSSATRVARDEFEAATIINNQTNPAFGH